MIEYALKDIDDNEYSLNDNSGLESTSQNTITFSEEEFSWEQKVVPRSGLPGSVKLGVSRLEGRVLSFNYTRAVGEDSDTFRAEENALLMWLNKTVTLVDKTNALQVSVSVQDHSPIYLPGSHKIMAEGSFTLMMLDPFWEDEVASNHGSSPGSGTTNIALSNDGFINVPPIITMTAAAAVTSAQLFVVSTNEGIEILDDIFGTPGFTIMVLDCKAGTLTIGDLDRRAKITAGTGFFQFPLGSFTLRVILSAGIDIDVDWFERSYL